jgi:4a-hydroxytetrahydrobiopterin dehydratase
MHTNLSEQNCQTLTGTSHVLSHTQCQDYLKQLRHWQLIEQGHAIHKIIHFDDYYRTMAFVNALAFIAHQQNHHPDLSVHYNRCEIRFSSHDVGGLSLNDFICAAKTDILRID